MIRARILSAAFHDRAGYRCTVFPDVCQHD
jgi:hypothetical protein